MQSEVTDINKQKFLAELGKLLTFMYDEDRQDALAMYARMFDAAPDEQAIIQFLVSPTRQAVVIARAYNARERKLQVNTTARDGRYDEEEGTPDYVRAISALEDEALSRKIIMPEVPEDQFTLFADGIHPVELGADEEDGTADEAPVPAVDETAAPAPAPEDAEEKAEEPEETETVTVEAESVELEGEVDDVDAFLSDFSIAGDELSEADSAAADEQPAEQTPVRVMPDASGKEPEFVFDAVDDLPRQTPPRPKKPAASSSAPAVELTERRAIVPLLILYIIIAVPVVALCVLILLVPTLFFLAMSVGAVVLGCMALSSAFGAFTIFADVMVVLGAALVVLALGLLFLWIFVWFVGGAIAGLINEIIKLGGKWCFKEVSAA